MQYHDFFRDIITEGRIDRYLPILTGRGGDYTDQEREYVQQVMSDFKRDDIIQWYLRWDRAVRITFGVDANRKSGAQDYNKRVIPPSDATWLEKYKEKINRPENTKTINGNETDVEYFELPWDARTRQMWVHYFSLPIPEIQEYRFANQNPRKVLGDFQYFEEEWKKKKEQESQWIDMTSELSYNNAPDDFQVGTVDEIIKLNNGFSWFNLNKAACEEEGSAMGHCGNSAGSAPTDTILSLRNVKKLNGRTFARPCVTFILNKKTGGLDTNPYKQYFVELIRELLPSFDESHLICTFSENTPPLFNNKGQAIVHILTKLRLSKASAKGNSPKATATPKAQKASKKKKRWFKNSFFA